MPSSAFIETALGQTITLQRAILLTMTHATFSQPFYFVNDRKDFVSNGITYIGFPFWVVRPTDSEDTTTGTLKIRNSDKRIRDAIRALALSGGGPIGVKVAMATAAEPNVEQRSYQGLRLLNVKVTMTAIEGDLTGQPYGSTPYPGRRATPVTTPSLFAK